MSDDRTTGNETPQPAGFPAVTGPAFVVFNVNDYVQVRLTDHGRKLHYREHEELAVVMRRYGIEQPYVEPKEVDGWSRWQAWELMRIFGRYLNNGCTPPFETTIRVEVDGQNTPVEARDRCTDTEQPMKYPKTSATERVPSPASPCSANTQIYGYCPMGDGKRWWVLEGPIGCQLGQGRTIAVDVSEKQMRRLLSPNDQTDRSR